MKRLRLIPVLAVLLVVLSCSPTAQSQEPIDVVVVQGRPWEGDALQAASLDECQDIPEVWDHRGPDDPSYSILPRAGLGEFARVRDWAGFETFDAFGCYRARPGEKYLDIKAIEIKCGPAVLQPQVLDEAGQAKAGNLIFLNWPGAEEFPVPVDPPYYQRGVGGFTDGGGSVGFGFGPGSQLTPGQGGPFNLWGASDPASWSDRVVGSDMLGSVGWFDAHCVPNAVFQIRRKGGDIPPTPPAATGYRLRNVGPNGEDLGYIPLLDNTPPVGAGRLELWQDDVWQGYVPWQTSR